MQLDNGMLLDRVRRTVSVHPVLDAQKGVAGSLEDTAHLKRRRDFCRRSKEPKYLKRIADEPACQQ